MLGLTDSDCKELDSVGGGDDVEEDGSAIDT